MTETTEINDSALAQFVLFSAKEIADWELNVPGSIETDEIWDGVVAKNVDHVDSLGDGVEVGGSFEVREVVGRIPASGGGRFDPPTNPPEVITESRKVYFTVRFTFEDLGMADATVEVV